MSRVFLKMFLPACRPMRWRYASLGQASWNVSAICAAESKHYKREGRRGWVCVGGTWYWNRYRGVDATCHLLNIPVHLMRSCSRTGPGRK